MDPITTAIVAALSAGATSGITATSQTAIADAYRALRNLFADKFGARSKVVQAIDDLKTHPASDGRKMIVQEEISALNATQYGDLLAAANHIQTLTQQAGLNNFTTINNGPVTGQANGNNPKVSVHNGNNYNHYSANDTAHLEEIPCPNCHKKTLRVHTKGDNSVILVCSNCKKTMRAGYNGTDLVKLAMPGVIALTGAVAIEHYIHTHLNTHLELGSVASDLAEEIF
jgi:hypothetical protein